LRLLILDTESLALDLAIRAQRWGHEVLVWDRAHKDGSPSRAGDGIVTKIKDFDSIQRKWLDWADLIYLPLNNFYVSMLEPYRQRGFPIYGCNEAGVKWETDRGEGQRVMKECGLNIIPAKEFHDYDDAIAYVKKNQRPFACKPNGEADKSLSHVADSPKELIYMLNRWKKNEKYRSDAAKFGFILQEKKEGCEMGIAGWFGPGGWCSIWEENFEYKKFMDGDLSVNTGEQGTLLRFVKQSKLVDDVLKPLTQALREISYVGCVDVNGCIDEQGGYWPYEFTMRDGWPAAHNHTSLHEGDPVQWMLDLVNGYDSRKVRFNECSISVVVSIPPYPHPHPVAKEVESIPIYNASDMEHVHLCEVMLGDVPQDNGELFPGYMTAGDYVLVVTGTGETITGARKSAYAAVRKIRMPLPPQYRCEIGKGKLVDNLEIVQKHGYAKGLTY
jgi:phosphoribosylamine--glycine ligase